MLLSPSSGSLLTDPGPLCAGQTATLTCNITGTGVVSLEWNYVAAGLQDGVIAAYRRGEPFSPSNPVVVAGVEFTVSVLMSTATQVVSQISFVASSMMSGTGLDCVGRVDQGLVPLMTTLQVNRKCLEPSIMFKAYR